MYIS
jgi:hypothetical protein